jgi:hypothetical protein
MTEDSVTTRPSSSSTGSRPDGTFFGWWWWWWWWRGAWGGRAGERAGGWRAAAPCGCPSMAAQVPPGASFPRGVRLAPPPPPRAPHLGQEGRGLVAVAAHVDLLNGCGAGGRQWGLRECEAPSAGGSGGARGSPVRSLPLPTAPCPCCLLPPSPLPQPPTVWDALLLQLQPHLLAAGVRGGAGRQPAVKQSRAGPPTRPAFAHRRRAAGPLPPASAGRADETSPGLTSRGTTRRGRGRA